MAVVTQDVGIIIDLTKGVHTNTVYDEDTNKIALKNTGTSYDEKKNIYATDGYWVSEIMDLVDKYTSLGNLALTTELNGAEYTAYTRTSSDNITWDDYVKINSSGKMMSVPQRYIQIKIEIKGQDAEYQEPLHDFTVEDIDKFEENEFINFSGNLELKQEYDYKVSKDDSWSDEGSLFRKKIRNTKFKRIDSIKL